jgi:UDPglucose--hexose-1-phosphate uridylyltransferase
MIKKRKKIKKFPSELRMDLVSNDWVVIATARARRAASFVKEKRIKDEVPAKKCPFCQQRILGKAKAILNKPDGSWFVLSVPNDFPAFSPGNELNPRKQGPNRTMNGLGYQEIVITAPHKKQLAQFSKEEIKMVVDVYQQRYLNLIKKKFIKYVSIFHNHGQEAGATVAHSHSQIAAIPVIDPDLRGSLDGAESFFRSQGKCVYCTMINWDLKDKQRIIYENEEFVALCPFAPQVSFEVRVYPKKHWAYFEKMKDRDKELFADALQKALSKIHKGLEDPPYNFYFHTAPQGSYDHYHWHLNILPRTSIMAGFELGAGIEISAIEPEKAAAFLRKVK